MTRRLGLEGSPFPVTDTAFTLGGDCKELKCSLLRDWGDKACKNVISEFQRSRVSLASVVLELMNQAGLEMTKIHLPLRLLFNSLGTLLFGTVWSL